MKIFDCFMFYDEEMILDIRLNYLNNYVDKFIIVESTFTHSGKKDLYSILINILNLKKRSTTSYWTSSQMIYLQ